MLSNDRPCKCAAAAVCGAGGAAEQDLSKGGARAAEPPAADRHHLRVMRPTASSYFNVFNAS